MPRPWPGHFVFGREAEGERERSEFPAWPLGISADVALAHPLPPAEGEWLASSKKRSADQRMGVHVWVLQNIMMQPCTFNVPSPFRLTLLL